MQQYDFQGDSFKLLDLWIEQLGKDQIPFFQDVNLLKLLVRCLVGSEFLATGFIEPENFDLLQPKSLLH